MQISDTARKLSLLDPETIESRIKKLVEEMEDSAGVVDLIDQLIWLEIPEGEVLGRRPGLIPRLEKLAQEIGDVSTQTVQEYGVVGLQSISRNQIEDSKNEKPNLLFLPGKQRKAR